MQIIENEKNAIVLFDGVCNFCNASVQFILKRDKNAYFKFAALQSETGKKLCEKYGVNTNSLDTTILIENGKAYTRSPSALRIARKLNFAWPLFYGFIIIPKFLRDTVYNLIAKNRYRLFGRKDECMIPKPEWKSRFLD